MGESEFQNEGVREIASDRSRGASQLARRCLDLLAEYARTVPIVPTPGEPEAVALLRRELVAFGKALKASRPSMAPIQNLIDGWVVALTDMPRDQLDAAREFAAAKACSLMDESVRAASQVSGHAAGLVAKGQSIITHSLSSTIIGVFRELSSRGVHAIITESRPLMEGRTLARQLSKLRVTTSFITDAQMGLFISKAHLAIVGADSILGDGSAVNKAGTYLLALAARDCGVPFYVCCETFKHTTKMAGEIELEEMEPGEFQPAVLPCVTAHNVYFDITPARLITGWVTENGVSVHPPLTAERPP